MIVRKIDFIVCIMYNHVIVQSKARQEAETTLNKYKQKMEKATQASSVSCA